MKVTERIKSLFRGQPWQPPTAEQLAARAEAQNLQEQFRRGKAVHQSLPESREGPLGSPP